MNQLGKYLQSPTSAYSVSPVKSGNSCVRSHTICTHQDISGPYTTPYINYSENTIALYTSFLLLLFFFGFFKYKLCFTVLSLLSSLNPSFHFSCPGLWWITLPVVSAPECPEPPQRTLKLSHLWQDGGRLRHSYKNPPTFTCLASCSYLHSFLLDKKNPHTSPAHSVSNVSCKC